MKNIKMVLLLIMLSCSAITYAQEVQDSSVVIKNVRILPAYLELKNSLLASDSVKAAATALSFSTELPRLHLRAHQLESLIAMKKIRAKVVAEAQEISATQNINKQRKKFADLSQDFWVLVKSYKFFEGSAYYDQCPMTGVTWISDKKEIANPYYPKNMKTCGKIEDQVE